MLFIIVLKFMYNETFRVKQRGVFPPNLFCIYIDCLLQQLMDSGLGSYVGHNFSCALDYADNISFISSSLRLCGIVNIFEFCFF